MWTPEPVSTIIRPLDTSKTGSTFVLKTVAFRALSSLSADRTSNELSDGPPGFHSLDEADSCSREVVRPRGSSHSTGIERQTKEHIDVAFERKYNNNNIGQNSNTN